MHVYPAKVLTPEISWFPVTAEESNDGQKFIVKAKDNTELAVVSDWKMELAPQEARTALDTERLWKLTGTLENGQSIEWAVTFMRGCGCGGTQYAQPSEQDMALFAAAV